MMFNNPGKMYARINKAIMIPTTKKNREVK
jgi:hypothetical protein